MFVSLIFYSQSVYSYYYVDLKFSGFKLESFGKISKIHHEAVTNYISI